MNDIKITRTMLNDFLIFQKNEITEYHIYKRLARNIKKEQNSELLTRIAEEEYKHYAFWKDYTNTDVKPNRFKIAFYYLIARLFGITFGIRLMEIGEKQVRLDYNKKIQHIPGAEEIANDEKNHEEELINLIEEKKLGYMGSVVLGLNDALVELTGALAGLTFALQNPRLVAIAGLITGIAAAFSMAASEYLSTKAEETDKHAVTSALYTGIAYLITVILLILPYLLIHNLMISLALTIITALIIILIFNFYISVAKKLSFKKRFMEMATISLGVAIISFGFGFLIRKFFGIEM